MDVGGDTREGPSFQTTPGWGKTDATMGTLQGFGYGWREREMITEAETKERLEEMLRKQCCLRSLPSCQVQREGEGGRRRDFQTVTTSSPIRSPVGKEVCFG